MTSKDFAETDTEVLLAVQACLDIPQYADDKGNTFVVVVSDSPEYFQGVADEVGVDFIFVPVPTQDKVWAFCGKEKTKNLEEYLSGLDAKFSLDMLGFSFSLAMQDSIRESLAEIFAGA